VFGDVVRSHRRRLGLTQEELAGKAGIGLRTIRDIETARISRPRQATVRRLADVFDLRGAARDHFHELAAPAAEWFAAKSLAHARHDEDARENLTVAERTELVALRREKRRLEAENEILRQTVAHFAARSCQEPLNLTVAPLTRRDKTPANRLSAAGQPPGRR
jgi:transcriptional regulator with XRE-family HTH domain